MLWERAICGFVLFKCAQDERSPRKVFKKDVIKSSDKSSISSRMVYVPKGVCVHVCMREPMLYGICSGYITAPISERHHALQTRTCEVS